MLPPRAQHLQENNGTVFTVIASSDDRVTIRAAMSEKPSPQADTGSTPPLRRLVSWNILEGMFLPPSGGETERRAPDGSRRRAALTLINRLKPDILVLNEALYCEEAFGQVEKYADLFGFPHATSRLYDGSWGNAILSRFPAADVVALTIHRAGASQDRGMLAAKLKFPEGEVWIATYHPHPQRRPKKRLEDYGEFLPLLPGPLLFVGDMNAISPEDDLDAAVLTKGFEHFRKKDVARREGERFVEAGHVLFEQVMPRFGLHDAMPRAERHYTIPTAMLSTDISGAMRIDHILANRGVRVEKAWVMRDGEADVASISMERRLTFRSLILTTVAALAMMPTGSY
jgi:endonuclease/exonuclease/phosphatase family metal-dependent hydrolase